MSSLLWARKLFFPTIRTRITMEVLYNIYNSNSTMATATRCRAYCLSLTQRPERFANAEAALKAALEPKIPLEMFPGIYGDLAFCVLRREDMFGVFLLNQNEMMKICGCFGCNKKTADHLILGIFPDCTLIAYFIGHSCVCVCVCWACAVCLYIIERSFDGHFQIPNCQIIHIR